MDHRAGVGLSDLSLGISPPQAFKRGSVIEFSRSKQFPIVSEGCTVCYIMLCNAHESFVHWNKKHSTWREHQPVARLGFSPGGKMQPQLSRAKSELTPFIKANTRAFFRLKLGHRQCYNRGVLFTHPCPGLTERQFCQLGEF